MLHKRPSITFEAAFSLLQDKYHNYTSGIVQLENGQLDEFLKNIRVS